MAHRRLRAALSILLGVAAVWFLVQSLRTEPVSWNVIHWPSIGRGAIAFTALALGMWLASSAWVVILGEGSEGHRTDFLTAQLAKYVPGGVWQPLSQVGLSATRNVSGKAAGSAIMVHAAAQIGAGLLLVPLLAVESGVPRWTKLSAIAVGVVGLIAVALGARIAHRLAGDRLRTSWSIVGAQARRSAGLGVIAMLAVNMAAQGLAFLLLVGGSLGLEGLGAYSVAWIVGFLAVPFPAGLGIREAILIALLPVGSAQVIAASLIQRVLAAASEGVLIFISKALR